MKTLLITAFLLAAPAAVQAQDATATATATKINLAVRADVAARPTETPAPAGTVKARTARIGEHTVRLVEGALPDKQASAAPVSGNSGS